MNVLLKKFFFCISGIVFLLLLLLFWKGYSKKTPYSSRESYALGTLIRIQAQGENAPQALDAALQRIAEIEDHMSLHSSSSDIAFVNQKAGIEPVIVHNDTFFVMEQALKYAQKSSGYFDPTIGPIVDLWGIGTNKEKLPTEKEITQRLPLVNYAHSVINKETQSIMLLQKGQMLDLGGIAKGYAADEVAQIFRGKGIKSALIDLGGNIYAYGTKADGTLWNIGIQDPLEPRGTPLGIVKVSNCSVVTSGNYERFFEVEGKRYHHIFDPHSGYPAASGLLSATIVSQTSIDGDALSTTLYILGKEGGLAFIERIPGVEALVVTEEKKIYATSGMSKIFRLIKGKGYIYEEGK
ncbi:MULTISPECIES: FAD:protein FMN transferase [Aminobacterium]|uniref:FAD:protein FMN transferase n=1 Tax=Aminobacterium TaxID=81466 RepID=UPI002579F77C|nr:MULTISPECIES: FAD:protein FMN transferase [unclassified Aminobacterium]